MSGLGAGGGASSNAAIGNRNLSTITIGNNNVGIGRNTMSALTTRLNNVAIGTGVGVIVNSDNQIAIGTSTLTSGANEMVIGNASNAVMRTMGDGICDLGSATNRYADLYLSGSGTMPTMLTPSIYTASTGTLLLGSATTKVEIANAGVESELQEALLIKFSQRVVWVF